MRHEFRIPSISCIVSCWGGHLKLARRVVGQQRATLGAEGASAPSKFRRNFALDTKGSLPAVATSRDRHVFSPVVASTLLLPTKLSAERHGIVQLFSAAGCAVAHTATSDDEALAAPNAPPPCRVAVHSALFAISSGASKPHAESRPFNSHRAQRTDRPRTGLRITLRRRSCAGDTKWRCHGPWQEAHCRDSRLQIRAEPCAARMNASSALT